MERIDIQERRRLTPDPVRERAAKQVEYRAAIERLRRGEPLHPERQQPTPAMIDAGGGYRPHVTTQYHPPLEPGDGDPMPKLIPVGPSVIEALTGRKPA